MEGAEQCDGTPDCVLLTRGDSSDENNCGQPRRTLMIHLFCAIAPVIVMLLTHLRIRLVLGCLTSVVCLFALTAFTFGWC